MSNPLAEYLSALEARDAREKAHEKYINAFTRLADRTAALSKQTGLAVDQPEASPSVSQKSVRPNTPKGKSSPAPDINSPNSLAQIRAELALTQKTRSDLETQVSALTAEISAIKITDTEQKKRIAQLEAHKQHLERRVKDRAEELKGKGLFVGEVQDEMVALNLQLNMAEKDVKKLRKENDDLTKRWVEKMEEEARRMNDQMGWEDKRRK